MITNKHPRFWSLTIRDRLVKEFYEGIVAAQGLIAHGRGEAFDYLLGEKTIGPAERATSAAAAFLLRASQPVISVNGNSAALVGTEIVKLASAIPARIEVNLFHRSPKREHSIAEYLKELGAKDILGIGSSGMITLPGVASPRAKADPKGIGSADVILVPLEDGDRALALRHAGKIVLAVDLNPLSRTSQAASVTIVDNIVRAFPGLVKRVMAMRKLRPRELAKITTQFSNQDNLASTISEMIRYLKGWT